MSLMFYIINVIDLYLYDCRIGDRSSEPVCDKESKVICF